MTLADPGASADPLAQDRAWVGRTPTTELPTLPTLDARVSARYERVTFSVTSVTSGVSRNAPAWVSPSRGSRNLNSSGSFLDLEKNRKIDHLQSTREQRFTKRYIGVSQRYVSQRVTCGEKEDEDLLKS